MTDLARSKPVRMRRREFLRATVIGAGTLALNPMGLARALAAGCSSTPTYGPLGLPDANGIRLPSGFSSRVVAQSGSTVPGTSHLWHRAPDGGATFGLSDGGWVYVSNSEIGSSGGAGAIRFSADGGIVGATQILANTNRNCGGGPTPWGTWLSCEEVDRGLVYECDPLNNNAARARPALGKFKHEAAAVDSALKTVYLTEDEPDGRFYRFRYDAPSNLSAGTLEVATVFSGVVTWTKVPDPSAYGTPTRHQVAGSTIFNGGEGAWYGNGVVHFTTKGDNRVWAYDGSTSTLSVIYDDNTSCNPVLTGVDNVVASRSGDIFVAEDGGDMQLVELSAEGSVSPFLQITNQGGSEITGPAFNPLGDRLYLSSQRGGPAGQGITYEIRGPFRAKSGEVDAPRLVGRIVSVLSGKCLDVPGFSHDDGVQLHVWTCHGGSNQLWEFSRNADGSSTIASRESGKVVDVAGWSQADGARVTQWQSNGGANQRFRLEPVREDIYRVVAQHSGKCLDIAGGSKSDGAKVIQWAYHGGQNQHWRIVRI